MFFSNPIKITETQRSLPTSRSPLLAYSQLACAWLETAVCACLVALQWAHWSSVRLSDTMLGCEIVVFGLQVRV